VLGIVASWYRLPYRSPIKLVQWFSTLSCKKEWQICWSICCTKTGNSYSFLYKSYVLLTLGLFKL